MPSSPSLASPLGGVGGEDGRREGERRAWERAGKERKREDSTFISSVEKVACMDPSSGLPPTKVEEVFSVLRP